MVDRAILNAGNAETRTQEMIAAYAARIEEIRTKNDRVGKPTDLSDITSLKDSGHLGARNFIEADGLLYRTLTRADIYGVPDRFDRDEHHARLDHIGTFAGNNSVLAVIDSTGRYMMARNTAENRAFLEEQGYKDVDRNFPVYFSNAEIPLGYAAGGQTVISFNVHREVAATLGRQPCEPAVFQSALPQGQEAPDVATADSSVA